MEFTQIKYFRKVAELQHVSRAAEELMITQPTLTKTIRNLENELEVPLLDHVGRNIELSEYGEIVLKYTDIILNAVNDMKAELEDRKGVQNNNLVVAMKGLMAVTPLVIREFILSHPDIGVNAVRGEKREYDVCIYTSNEPQEDSVLLMREECLLCISEENPLAKQEVIEYSDLAEENFVITKQKRAMHEILLKIGEKAGFEPKIRMECDSIEGVLSIVESNMGGAIVPERTWNFGKRRRIVLKRIGVQPIYRYVYMKTRKNAYMTKAMKRFTEYLSVNFERFCEERMNP